MDTIVIVVFLLPVASYRLTRLITKDTFPPVLWLRDRLAGGWRPLTHPEWVMIRSGKGNDLKPFEVVDDVQNRYVQRVSWSPFWLAELLSCPWCASAYVSAALTAYGALWSWYTWPVALLVWLYAWGVAAVVAAKEWA